MKVSKEILKLYKNLGETPLECLLRFRKDNPEFERVNMTYLGRLDPLAEGLMLVLAGNTRDKQKYLEWDKTYEFEVLWGFETDTYDVLGKVTNVGVMPLKNFDKHIDPLLKKISEKKTQQYPPYSSKTVSGKSLHAWAREGKISEIEIPTRSIKIFSIEHLDTRLVSQGDVLREIKNKLSLVKGDFRQTEILKIWGKSIRSEGPAIISSFRASVSSGTYIRSLAHDMGHILGTYALAYSIKRTRVGQYSL